MIGGIIVLASFFVAVILGILIRHWWVMRKEDQRFLAELDEQQKRWENEERIIRGVAVTRMVLAILPLIQERIMREIEEEEVLRAKKDCRP